MQEQEQNPCVREIPRKINYDGFGKRISQKSKSSSLLNNI